MGDKSVFEIVKNRNQYECIECQYKTGNKTDYSKHLMTAKHKKLQKVEKYTYERSFIENQIVEITKQIELQNKELKKELLEMYSVNEKLLVERSIIKKSINELNKLI